MTSKRSFRVDDAKHKARVETTTFLIGRAKYEFLPLKKCLALKKDLCEVQPIILDSKKPGSFLPCAKKERRVGFGLCKIQLRRHCPEAGFLASLTVRAARISSQKSELCDF